MKTSLYDIKYNTRTCEFCNIYPNDPRLVSLVNEGVARMMTRGLYWGSYMTMDVALSSRFLTLPPQLETIETIAVSQVALPIRDSFYQYIDSGWGPRDETQTMGTGIDEAMYLGNYPIVTDIVTPYTVLNLKCDLATDVGKTVLLLGYDSNGNWIRTLQGGVYADGEVVVLAQGGGTNSVKLYSKVVDIQPPSNLDGQWWLYQGATLLGNYQFFEQRPSYKRYLVPFLTGVTPTARVIGRRTFVPVKNDTDYTVLGNRAAIKLACRAIRAEEESDWTTASLMWNGGIDKRSGINFTGAIQELDFELQYELGIGREVSIDIKSNSYQEVLETVL